MDKTHSSTTIGDLVELQRGTTYKSALLGEEGPILLGLGSIARNGGFKGDNLKAYSGPSDPKILLKPGDLYVSLKDVTQSADLLGAVSRVPNSVIEGRLTQDTVKLIFKDTRTSTDYIYWLLRTPAYRAYCRAHATGTTNLGLSREDFFAFPVPSFTKTRAALIVLFQALEDKIDLNRRMNETLEATARALFKDWFVDFGPTKAKMEGREPYLEADLWALFPERLDEEGKPEGWAREPLDQTADFLNGLALQKYPATGESYLPVIKIAELRSGVTAKSGRASPHVPSQYVVEDGDVLFSWSGSLTHLVWTGGRGALNQHLFKVTSDTYPKWFYYFWIGEHMPEFQTIAASKATTMGHIQRRHLTAAETFVPPQNLLDVSDNVISPLFNRMVTNNLESRTLAQTRDLLLPKLMSGEVRVGDAGEIVEEVL